MTQKDFFKDIEANPNLLYGYWTSEQPTNLENIGSTVGNQDSAFIASRNKLFEQDTSTYYQPDPEEWDGVSWSTSSPNLFDESYVEFSDTRTMAGRYQSACVTGGLRYSGGNLIMNSSSEEWDGVSWSSISNLIIALGEASSAGFVNDMLVFGGLKSLGGRRSSNYTQYYDGTSWSQLANMTYDESYNYQFTDISQGDGLSNDAIAYSSKPEIVNNISNFDGTTWTAKDVLLVPLSGGTEVKAASSGSGSSTSFVIVYANTTKIYDGTSFRLSNPPLIYSRLGANQCGNSSNCFIGGANIDWEFSTNPWRDRTYTRNSFRYNEFSLNKQKDLTFSSFGVWSDSPAPPSPYIPNKALVGQSEDCLSFADLLTNASFSFDGISWSSEASASFRLREGMCGCGTSTSTLGIDGYSDYDVLTIVETSDVQEYDGISWHAKSSPVFKNKGFGGVTGTVNDALLYGGAGDVFYLAKFNVSDIASENFDGTSWSIGANQVFAKRDISYCGSSTSALNAGGWSYEYAFNQFLIDLSSIEYSMLTLEVYDGTTWSLSKNSLPIKLKRGAMSGTSTEALQTSGQTQNDTIYSSTLVALEYNNDVWKNVMSLPYEIVDQGQCGTMYDSLVVGQKTSGGTNISSRYQYITINESDLLRINVNKIIFEGKLSASLLDNSSVDNIDQKFYDSATCSRLKKLSVDPTSGLSLGDIWYNTTTDEVKIYGYADDPNFVAGIEYQTGPSSLYYRYLHNSVGSPLSSNALIIGGRGDTTSDYGNFSDLNSTEEYDGLSFSLSSNLLNTLHSFSANGNSASSYAYSGYDGSSVTDTTQEYDGTSWSYGANLNTARRNTSGDGTPTACIVVGGYQSFGSWLSSTEEYNGTSWQNSVTFPREAEVGHVLGTENAYLCKVQDSTYEFDGISFSALPDFPDNYETYQKGAAMGNLSSAHICGGDVSFEYNPENASLVRGWDSISWSYLPSLPQPRKNTSGTGSISAGDGLITGGDYGTQYLNTTTYVNTTLVSFLNTIPPKVVGAYNINFETDSTIDSTVASTIDSTIDSTVSSTIDSTIDSTVSSTIDSTMDSTSGSTV